MKKYIDILFVGLSFSLVAQNNLKDLLEKYNTKSVPYISVDSLKSFSTALVLLDSRAKKEYKVSHLKNAFFVGYEKFNLKKTTKSIPNKNAEIVVYCSLGMRSEDIAEQLKKAGYTNVLNLYGGIFEWKNNGNTVYNCKEIATEKVHTFSKEWSKWLLKGEKVN